MSSMMLRSSIVVPLDRSLRRPYRRRIAIGRATRSALQQLEGRALAAGEARPRPRALPHLVQLAGQVGVGDGRVHVAAAAHGSGVAEDLSGDVIGGQDGPLAAL